MSPHDATTPSIATQLQTRPALLNMNAPRLKMLGNTVTPSTLQQLLDNIIATNATVASSVITERVPVVYQDRDTSYFNLVTQSVIILTPTPAHMTNPEGNPPSFSYSTVNTDTSLNSVGHFFTQDNREFNASLAEIDMEAINIHAEKQKIN